MVVSNLLLIMSDERVKDELFDPCRTFMKTAIHCARVMMHYLNVSGVPSIVGEAETDVAIELAEGVELLDVASEQGPMLMETSSGGEESDEGMIENMELAEVPLDNEQGMYEVE